MDVLAVSLFDWSQTTFAHLEADRSHTDRHSHAMRKLQHTSVRAGYFQSTYSLKARLPIPGLVTSACPGLRDRPYQPYVTATKTTHATVILQRYLSRVRNIVSQLAQQNWAEVPP